MGLLPDAKSRRFRRRSNAVRVIRRHANGKAGRARPSAVTRAERATAIIRRTPSKRANAMITVPEEYLVDEAGNRKAVVLPLAAWRRIIEELEELDDIRAYDAAKAEPSQPIPFAQAMREIQEGDID